MKFDKFCYVIFIVTFSLVTYLTDGCHNYHHRRRRQASIDIDVRKTANLRKFFSQCLSRKARNVFQSWDSVVDFVILDTRWFNKSDSDDCRNSIGGDTTDCWKKRISDLLKSNSLLVDPSRECIDEYGNGLADGCLGGEWTEYFDRDNPVGQGDIETLLSIKHDNPVAKLCTNPSNIEAKIVSSKKDYRTGGQVVNINPTLGLVCRHRDQNGSRCHDYMVRFCCPSDQIDSQNFIDTNRRFKRQLDSNYNPRSLSNYTNCLVNMTELGINRPMPDFDSIINFTRNHLVCNSFAPNGDCWLNINSSDNETALTSRWPYLLQAVIKRQSNLLFAVSECNSEYFSLSETNSPETIDSPPVNDWGQWSTWGKCSASCGNEGNRQRNRTCSSGLPGSAQCPGVTQEQQVCYPENCPKWTSWNPWSPCRNISQVGLRTRSRSCLNGTLRSNKCSGQRREINICRRAPFVGRTLITYSPWSRYGPCVAECGESSFHERTRSCSSNIGPAACSEPLKERKSCTKRCGMWSEWTQYSPCSKTCGEGIQTRRRRCVNGTPGSEGCRGPIRLRRSCFMEPCERENETRIQGWSNWSNWGPCTAQCNQIRSQIRTRNCTTGLPGSPSCQGSAFSTKFCRKLCGFWSNWGSFSRCRGRCGNSTQTRRRICFGGNIGEENCLGKANEMKSCFTGRNC